MEIRSRAPLRLGLAGGGTDLPTFCKNYGGTVFSATIGMYAYCTIKPTNNNRIKIISFDNNDSIDCPSISNLSISDNKLILHKGVYNRIVKEFNNGKPLSFTMSTSNDAPIGSGLGTSSTMIVAILEAFDKWLKLGLSKYQKAKIAYEIERIDLNLSGGKQDQYSAVFGGFNLIEFNKDDSVVVNSLRINEDNIEELECSLLLFYCGISRSSSKIIDDQIKKTEQKNTKTLKALNKLKDYALQIKNAIILGDFKKFARVLNLAWINKKKTSAVITNTRLNNLIDYIKNNGAEAVKISGAGGGGILMIYFNPINRQKLINALTKLEGHFYPVKFTQHGVSSWIIN